MDIKIHWRPRQGKYSYCILHKISPGVSVRVRFMVFNAGKLVWLKEIFLQCIIVLRYVVNTYLWESTKVKKSIYSNITNVYFVMNNNSSAMGIFKKIYIFLSRMIIWWKITNFRYFFQHIVTHAHNKWLLKLIFWQLNKCVFCYEICLLDFPLIQKYNLRSKFRERKQ
jgi:hypothetical protein